MDKLELVEEAIKEWLQGKLDPEQALYNIMISISIRPPSAEMIEWAEEAIKSHNGS